MVEAAVRPPGRLARLLGWPRVAARAAQLEAAERDRRPSGWELPLVLLLFPASSAVSAVAILLQQITHTHSDAGYVPAALPDRPWLSAALAAGGALVEFGPALLAVYLLRLSGGGAAAIGLDRASPRADLARCGKLMVLAYGSGFLLEALISAATRTGNPVAHAVPPSPAYLLPLLLGAAGAGVVEEIVVLGYLVHRLEQRGWGAGPILLAATAVRASYHLYYGWGTVGIALWAAVSVVLYRRRRRLLTFIVLHALWDGFQFVTIYLHGARAALPALAVAATLGALWLAGRRPAAGEWSGRPAPAG